MHHFTIPIAHFGIDFLDRTCIIESVSNKDIHHMRIKRNIFTVTNKAKLFIAAGVVVLGTSTAAAFTMNQPSQAGQPTPIDVQVQDHEQRITKNESAISDTQDQLETVKQQAQTHSEAITVVQDRVTVVEKQAGQVKAAEQVVTPVETPAPKPLNPRLITSVQTQEMFNPEGENLGWNCRYTFETGATKSLRIGSGECLKVGDIY